MVFICGNNYEKEFNVNDMFSFPLSSFQKYAIEGIMQDKHVLICVPTGNGKTLPAEFAIQYFFNKGKKVIYTSPIKALSNQKYYDFKEKYPHIQFGLLTGDIKLNPTADVLIMTAEILQNSLLQKEKSFSTFEMDYENELACVIHDEVHSIGLQDRGHVWENIFMLLPSHVQNVMLSATLDKPENFAQWVENIHNCKEVYLISLKERAVPLFHYSFITCNEGFFKKLKDKVLEKEIREIINKPVLLKENNSLFNEMNYRKISKALKHISQKGCFLKRHFVLNNLCKYLFENNMLPCACFILSRKQLEIAAREITVPLLEDDSKTPYIIKNKCEKLLREKLPNYDEFIGLPEYISMISLLEKGIATHHSGTLPILKEIVEILFVQGYIKMLFCTETFSCGLNMPIKTTIFTDINKFDGRDFRLLYGYEYNQASGRAGRRGLDTKGYVIHLNNLFKTEVNIADYKNMMAGNPQKLNSHYKISYHLLFSSISFSLEKSLIQKEIDNENRSCEIECLEKEKESERIEKSLLYLKTPLEDIKKYVNINSLMKKKKEDIRMISILKEKYYSIDEDCKVYLKINKIDEEIKNIKKNIETNKNFLYNKIKIINDFLIKEGYNTTIKINLAKCFKEVPCLVFSELIYKLDSLSVNDIAMILSCYTNIHISSEEKRCIQRPNINSINEIMNWIEINSVKYTLFENNNYIDTGEEYEIHYDLMEYIEKWIEAENVEECKYVLYLLLEEKDLFVGEFVKAMLKIIAICNEIINACEIINNFSLMEKIKILNIKIQKYIVSNQSLYI
jgi:ATP-dependent RNA helicase DOB1